MQLLDRQCHFLWLIRVKGLRVTGACVAEPAAACADVAADHERCRAIAPALVAVGAEPALTDRMQAVLMNDLLRVAIVVVGQHARPHPLGFGDMRRTAEEQAEELVVAHAADEGAEVGACQGFLHRLTREVSASQRLDERLDRLQREEVATETDILYLEVLYTHIRLHDAHIGEAVFAGERVGWVLAPDEIVGCPVLFQDCDLCHVGSRELAAVVSTDVMLGKVDELLHRHRGVVAYICHLRGDGSHTL